MLRIWVHRIRPEKEDRLRAWLSELNMRAGEVRESFRLAGIHAEQAAVVPSGGGLLLVYVSDAEDQRQAAQTFEASQLAIDHEHRRVLEECIEETLDAIPVYDVSNRPS